MSRYEKDGKFIDSWSLVHFVSGWLLVSATYELGYGFSSALVISVSAMVAWEIFEWLTGIIEPTANVTSDIVIGTLGFLLGAYWYFYLDTPFNLTIFSWVLGINILLGLRGFYHYLQKHRR